MTQVSSWMKVSTDQSHVSCIDNTCEINYPCSDSFTCHAYELTLNKGFYFIEVFGAEGGGYSTPGKGGGIKGFILLRMPRKYYAFIGAKGVNENNNYTQSTFGGGGSAYGYDSHQFGGSGGGASDLRTKIDDLNSRIIVAGGGGGGGKNTYSDYLNDSPGGDGSGDNGRDSTSQKGTPGSGALTDGPGEKGNKGTFGFGGNATQQINHDGSGGGGGYYGGNAAIQFSSGGGGGSGYINKKLFSKYESLTGVREGHGMIRITQLLLKQAVCTRCVNVRNHYFVSVIVSLMIS